MWDVFLLEQFGVACDGQVSRLLQMSGCDPVELIQQVRFHCGQIHLKRPHKIHDGISHSFLGHTQNLIEDFWLDS